MMRLKNRWQNWNKSTQNNFLIWCLTVPPILSHGDFQWLVAKNTKLDTSSKSFWCMQRFLEVHLFLYWTAQPSEKYSNWEMCGSSTFKFSITKLWILWTILTSCNISDNYPEQFMTNLFIEFAIDNYGV